jgi:2-polyprenyl-3-methyl-5-hydroxy-6-metoxy-1,4-benzoquinol methylase
MEFDKYDKNGAYHIEWFRTNKHGYRNHLNRILREFTGCKAKLMLDIGCGEGLLAKLLLKKGVTQKVLGIDTSKKAVELGKDLYADSCKTKRMELKCQDFKSMNKRRKFDYIVCSEVIEHVDNPELFLRKINNMTKKWAIITTPNSEFVTPGKYDKTLFSPKSLRTMLIMNDIEHEFLESGATIIVKIIK